MTRFPFKPSLLVLAVGAALGAAPAAFAEKNPLKQAYFGDTHVHTAWSFDAFVFGTRTTPEEAYQYALGRPIKSPGGYQIQLKQPLDFSMVTDHAEFMGVLAMAQDPNSDIGRLPIAEKLKVRSKQDLQRIYMMVVESMLKNKPIPELDNPEISRNVWSQIVAAADKYYQPGKFTTFAAYEWTSTPNNANLHRNIIFRDAKKVPAVPFTSVDSDRPEDLWAWMDEQRQSGNEVLAISHNGNVSDGLMFPVEVDMKGRPIDTAYAEQRMRNEPLSEVAQIKGTSETHPTLSPNDEFANFEILNNLLGGSAKVPTVSNSYIREAYRNGIAMQEKNGFNPYKFGLVGGSDSHNGAGAYSENSYFGQHGQPDSSAQQRTSVEKLSGMDIRQFSSAGLGGVWAEENTREAIYDAFKRKETFGTTGPRIRVRFFGGWDYPLDGLKQKDWVKSAYANGVPMGSDLPAKKSQAPRFIVSAVKDPDSGNLDRIQIVKGWTKHGQTFEKVFDVSWSGKRKIDPKTGKLQAVGNTVDIKKASYHNSIGAVSLQTVWTDPEFDPGLHAFYYARVLEIPTPRWSTHDAKTLGVAPPAELPASIQERAYTSPIWYNPSTVDKRVAKPGLSASDLARMGGTQLDDQQIKALVLGKTLKVKNIVSGQRMEVLYGVNGRSMTLSIGGKPSAMAEISDVTNDGAPGAPSKYEIHDKRLIGKLAGKPFEATVYQVGKQYYLMKNREFGYANWLVESIE